ncbi:GntR family transcriptional regulator [Conexibacter sp. CPCC 206217]|uniref:GntR family transcriptional regulator n=1 Tax=Conexibacter sp. CPCC 206217 TaxID=3064574 RepID=UPI002715C70D|nr:GntR family transcriptional regulator [Conexibacter sp. CPCC 206217]MDO8208818.1 GntR family transcriptional regulator [Conexibacter sp. CPCC 206217]
MSDVVADVTSLQYERLRKELLEGEFPPGTVLLETVLSARYGVSRTPVREALGRLAQDGLLERSSRGFTVRRRSPEEILEIYDARIALESTSAALAAERHTAFDLARLTHLLEQRRAATDGAEAGRLNRAWHTALRDASHNRTIDELLDRLDGLLAVYRPGYTVKADPDREAVEHEQVLEAIRRRDAEGARLAMVEHLRHGRDLRIQAFLDAAPDA